MENDGKTVLIFFVEYVHDPLGRRIAKKVNGVIAEKYLWQGMTRLLAVYDNNNALVMRFEYADAGMPFAMTMGSTTYFLTYDQVGSLRTVVNTSGTVIKQIEYDSFGNIINDTNQALKMPFGFAGGLHDRDTGLVRFGYRDYDPDTGRWTAKDPIGFDGGDTDLYGYCVNAPVNWVDILGLVNATRSGTVTRAGWENPRNQRQGFGWRIYITTNDGCQDIYAHMDPASTPAVGTVVNQGDNI